MFYFPDILVLFCLYTSGFHFGYYFKFAYIYDNLWQHWYALGGALAALLMAAAWTLKKFQDQQYRFNHFYVIFYGLVCYVIEACFLLTDNVDISFYFGFVGLGTTIVPSYSFISLRSSSSGYRPACIALGYTFYFGGFTTGFSVFNEFEPHQCGWICLALSVLALLGTAANEVLQHIGIHNYKQSRDLVYNLMNDEKLLFVSRKSIYALFVGRPDFYLVRNRQWLVLAVSVCLVLERICFFSPSVLQLAWSSSFAYLYTQYLYGPCLIYTLGCAIGCALMTRYQTKLIYLMFGLIKLTTMAAILGVYGDETPEDCFLFLCFYYVALGVYASIAFQLLVECTPFLYTEFALAVAFALELLVLEMLKYETNAENFWSLLLGVSIGSMLLTGICMLLAYLLLPRSQGLIDIRNYLLGVRRHRAAISQTKIWHTNYFLQPQLQPDQVTEVRISADRVFQQYPRSSTDKTKL